VIADYTLKRWGEDQMFRYLDDLEACCQKLAKFPELGRKSDEIRPGLRRMEHGKHVILYREKAEGFGWFASCINACCRSKSEGRRQILRPVFPIGWTAQANRRRPPPVPGIRERFPTTR
jgi:hypothetical protein